MKKFILLFLFVCMGANSAQLVGNEILLCTNGYSSDGSSCVAYSGGDCDSGYYELSAQTGSFVSPEKSLCAHGGYKSRTLPDTTITLTYHGAVLGEEVALCDNGYSSDGSLCALYSGGDCDSGYYEIPSTATSFFGPEKGLCKYGGYKSHTLPDTTITLTYRGVVLGNETTLCDNGYSADGTTCVSYGTANCPSGYYGVDDGTASFARKDGSCATGYTQYIAEDSCGFEPAGSTCISFCSSGEFTTGAGLCSTLCAEGATVFRTSNGLRYPLWATKQTTPALNVGFANGNQCYVNLTDEATDETSVWVQDGNNRLHTMK